MVDFIPNPRAAALGGFMTRYAAAEMEIKLILSAILDLSIYEFAVVAEPYSGATLRNVAKSIVKLKLAPDDPMRDKLLQAIGTLYSYSTLRNQIAHAKWAPGRRPDSIQPLYVQTRSGRARFVGSNDEDDDYTTEELVNLANEVKAINNRLYDLKLEGGYNAIIERNMSRKRYSIEDEGGNSSSDSSC